MPEHSVLPIPNESCFYIAKDSLSFSSFFAVSTTIFIENSICYICYIQLLEMWLWLMLDSPLPKTSAINRLHVR